MAHPSEIASSCQSRLPLGAVIAGKYRIDGVLGTGGMGIVLSATNLDLDAPVAIKIVREELTGNEEVVSRMVQEARSSAKMHGPHTVRVLDVARLETGTPYIVMECLDGSDLATLLSARGALPIREAIEYVLQACDGLAEAHALGIVHRDLKPENLFLADTADGPVLKILDFGISKVLGDGGDPGLTNAGCAVGSPYYMSPEQMRASPRVDQRADIWSLGALLFELMTGKCPFNGESVQVVCANVLNADAPSLRQVSEQAPEALDQIVRRCLEKNPDARYENVGALAAALRAFLSSEEERSADENLRLVSGISRVPSPERNDDDDATVRDVCSLVVRTSPTLQSRLHPGLARASVRRAGIAPLAYQSREPKHRAVRFAAFALALGLGAGAFVAREYGRMRPLESPPARESTAAVHAALAHTAARSNAASAPAPSAIRAEHTRTAERDARQPPSARRDGPLRIHARRAPLTVSNGVPSPIGAAELPPAATVPNESDPADATAAPATPLESTLPSPEPPAPAETKPPPPASAAFEDVPASPPSPPSPERRAPVNAWDVGSLGGRY